MSKGWLLKAKIRRKEKRKHRLSLKKWAFLTDLVLLIITSHSKFFYQNIQQIKLKIENFISESERRMAFQWYWQLTTVWLPATRKDKIKFCIFPTRSKLVHLTVLHYLYYVEIAIPWLFYHIMSSNTMASLERGKIVAISFIIALRCIF